MRVVHASAGGFSTCLAASLLLANAAHAQGFEQPWRGVYLGGGGTYSTVSVKVPGSGCYDDCWWGDYDQYEDGDGDFGYSLHAGLRVHDFVALEASYVDTGSIRWDEDLVYFPEFNDYYNNRVDFSAQITEVSVLGILPAGRFELYLRLGAGVLGCDERTSAGPVVRHRRRDPERRGQRHWLRSAAWESGSRSPRPCTFDSRCNRRRSTRTC
jgi:hypothetical protein